MSVKQKITEWCKGCTKISVVASRRKWNCRVGTILCCILLMPTFYVFTICISYMHSIFYPSQLSSNVFVMSRYNIFCLFLLWRQLKYHFQALLNCLSTWKQLASCWVMHLEWYLICSCPWNIRSQIYLFSARQRVCYLVANNLAWSLALILWKRFLLMPISFVLNCWMIFGGYCLRLHNIDCTPVQRTIVRYMRSLCLWVLYTGHCSGSSKLGIFK